MELLEIYTQSKEDILKHFDIVDYTIDIINVYSTYHWSYLSYINAVIFSEDREDIIDDIDYYTIDEDFHSIIVREHHTAVLQKDYNNIVMSIFENTKEIKEELL